MAETMARHRPDAADAFLAGVPELIQFPGGEGALSFTLGDGAMIPKLFDVLPDGEYGDAQLIIKAGFAVGLLASDRQPLTKAMGIPKALVVGGVFLWA
jgi:hypothetical protein